MKILRENMKELFAQTKYILKNQHENEELNASLNFWNFLEEKEGMLQGLSDISLEMILYSKYYWCSKYVKKYTELYGTDAGLEQQQYKIMEELERRLKGDIDWELVEYLSQ